MASNLVILTDESVDLRLDEVILIVKHFYMSFIRLCLSQIVKVFVVSSEIRYFLRLDLIFKTQDHCFFISNVSLNLMAFLTNNLALLFYSDLLLIYLFNLLILLPQLPLYLILLFLDLLNLIIHRGEFYLLPLYFLIIKFELIRAFFLFSQQSRLLLLTIEQVIFLFA